MSCSFTGGDCILGLGTPCGICSDESKLTADEMAALGAKLVPVQTAE